MDRFPRIFPALALCLLPFSHSEARQAQPCEDAMLRSLAAQLGQNDWSSPNGDANGLLVAAACKLWPDNPNLSVVTLAYRDAEDSTPSGERNFNWLVAKVDTRSGQLRERYDDYLGEDSALELDATSLWLDTARYRLAPGVRAFGVVISSVARGASCPDAGSNDLLTLVVPEGAKLRPVFSTYLHAWTTIKGTACVMESDFQSEQADLTLDIAPTRSHAYADLLLSAHVRAGREENVLRTVRTTVRYDGNQYPFKQYATFWTREEQP